MALSYIIPIKLVAAKALAVSMQLVSQGASYAQDAGAFRMLQSYVRDYTTLSYAGGKVTGGILAGTNTIIESSGPPFVQDQAGLVRCFVRARTVQDSAVSLEASCTVTDVDGDELYLLARRDDGDTDAGGGGTGAFRIEGGTGKYVDVSGNCPYDTQYLPDNLVVTIGTCTWERTP